MPSLQNRLPLHSITGTGFSDRQALNNAGHHASSPMWRSCCQYVGHHQNEIIQRSLTVYLSGFELAADFVEDAAVQTALAS